MNKTNKVLNLDDISSGFNGSHDRTGALVGSKQFGLLLVECYVLKNHLIRSISHDVDLALNIIGIPSHNFQTGQTLFLTLKVVLRLVLELHLIPQEQKILSYVSKTSGVSGSAMYEMDTIYRFQAITGTA